MLHKLVSPLITWLSQVTTIVSHWMSDLQPNQYGTGLVFCICVGYVLLRSRD